MDKEKLTTWNRVVLDMTTLNIMRALPREVDPVLYNMLHEDPGNVSYSFVGRLSDRESIELPLMNHELFLLVGTYQTTEGCSSLWTSGNRDANFLKVVSVPLSISISVKVEDG